MHPATATSPPLRAAMSVAEFADYANIGLTLAREVVKTGRVKARRITKRRVVILQSDAEDFMNSLPVINMAEAA